MQVARRAIFALMFVLNGALTLCLTYLYFSRGFDPSGSFTSVELITIVLTALAVILTALGLFIAGLAIWGYQALHSAARDIAERVAKRTAEDVASRTAADAVTRLDESIGSERDYGAAAGRSNGDEQG
ncbi:hypothetical protein PZ895_00545 [Mesorhizobium sp. YIM 152430]|uniref:hypothetical protein n=1 Tax=Mesorhizobium sp. YIM 152430 TaxID=3031761 RepID=UPI0023DCA5BA|nr:hypothetical protein [Mesorhizobium sp. YIM 152430]MDF1598265.1 hypothetical protein [Mesorhizobium sp. YIM 152430]